MVSHRSLSDNKSPQVSRSLLSILADLNNVVVGTVYTCPLIFQSSSSVMNPLVTVPIVIGISVTFMFHSFCFSVLLQGQGTFLSFWFLSALLCGQLERQSLLFDKFSFFFCCCWLSQGLVVWPSLGDPFVSQNPREVCASHFLGRILDCAYTICSYGQISISCTIPSGSPSPPGRVSSCSFLLAYCIHQVDDCSFHLYHLITYICNFLSRQFLLWYSPYVVILCCYQKRFSFSFKASLSQPSPSFFM